ncbi:MAG: antitoxin Xre/MbcA/ParS toxin-binding domain-containing protein [Ginsengibacter sp.]|jgi:putative toxin-antitoxin system antitoxin component (TIGR02293 family)
MQEKSKKYSTKNATPESGVLSEAAVAYTPQLSIAFSFLKESQSTSASDLTPFEKMHVVREGVSKKDLEMLKTKAKMDYTSLAKALSVTRATLINKKRGERFNPGLSEKIVGLADLYSYGFEVFEDEEAFTKWMQKPNKALGGEIPVDVIDNQFGREEIKNVLGRIAYGVYS